MDTLLLYLDEWPWIFTLSVAAFLSFDYWRLPDLTIESAFTAGMASLFLASTHSVSGGGFLVLLGLLLLAVPTFLSLATWSLYMLRLPSLFAGLVVTLGAYTLNFHLNGAQASQQIYVSWQMFRISGLDTSAHFLLFALLWSGLIAVVLGVFTTRTIGVRIFLSRRTVEPVVPDAIGINGPLSTLLAMIVYNIIAFTGGVGFALKTSMTSVSMLGAIIPGLACMFILQAIRGLLATPTLGAAPQTRGALTNWLIRKSDSIWILLLSLALLSAITSVLRMAARDYANGVAMLNAYTAIGIFLMWALMSGVGFLMGKRISSNRNEHF